MFVVVLLIGMGLDFSRNKDIQEGIIHRQDIGEESTEENMVVTIEGIEGSIEYVIDVEAMRPTREQAEKYFEDAIAEMEQEFELLNLEEAVSLPFREHYVDGIVSAEWNVDPWEAVNVDGTIVYEKIPEEGVLINISVTLDCGEYERIYQFPLRIPCLEKDLKEKVLGELNHWIESEMKKEGERNLVLPMELLGHRVFWSREKSNLTLSFLVLEVLAVVAIVFMTKQKEEMEERKRTYSLEADYPEVVGQLTLLLGAGMNIRQAWNIIATRYLDNRQKRLLGEKVAYEGIVRMNRRMQEGENEKKAYQEFASEMKNVSYHRLIRLLIGNLEKGSRGMCAVLEQESKQAYEQRVLRAKKAGEEASTRMLMPLMLMMLVVMTIVMAPAMVDFIG